MHASGLTVAISAPMFGANSTSLDEGGCAYQTWNTQWQHNGAREEASCPGCPDSGFDSGSDPTTTPVSAVPDPGPGGLPFESP